MKTWRSLLGHDHLVGMAASALGRYFSVTCCTAVHVYIVANYVVPLTSLSMALLPLVFTPVIL